MLKEWKNSSGIGKNGFPFRMLGYSFGAFLIVYTRLAFQEPFSFFHWLTFASLLLIPPAIFKVYNQKGHSKEIEFGAIYFDLFCGGWIAGSLGFSPLISFAYFLAVFSNYLASFGPKKIYAALLFPLGGIIAFALTGFQPKVFDSPVMNLLSYGYLLVHSTVLSLITFYFIRLQLEKRKIVRLQKEELEQQREEIHVQAEELKALNDALTTLNETLGERIEQRTQDLYKKNQKLAEYAFINAHELRAPVARISGLIQLYENDSIGAQEKNEIFLRLKASTKQLDQTIRQIRKMIEDELKD